MAFHGRRQARPRAVRGNPGDAQLQRDVMDGMDGVDHLDNVDTVAQFFNVPQIMMKICVNWEPDTNN